jgi:LysR family glycine cleavage system transcriptional activator
MNDEAPAARRTARLRGGGAHLSFTRAAEELFVTQSAVSKQVIALESALECTPVRAQDPRPAADRPASACSARLTLAFSELRAATGVARRRRTDRDAGHDPGLRQLLADSAPGGFSPSPSRHRHPHLGRYPRGRPRTWPLRRAVRYLQDRNAPAGALRLFGDTVLPVAARPT